MLANIDFCYNRLIFKLYRILSKNPKKPPYSKIYTRFHFLKVIFVHILKDLYNEWTRRGPKSNLIKSRTLYGRIVVKKSNNWVTILNIIRYSFKCYLIFDQNLRNFGRKIDFQHVYNWLSEAQKQFPEPDINSQKAKIEFQRWKSYSRGSIKHPGQNFTLLDAKAQPLETGSHVTKNN